MKKILVLMTLLSLSIPCTVFSEEHDHSYDEERFLDLSETDTREGHGDHEDAEHGHDEGGHEENEHDHDAGGHGEHEEEAHGHGHGEAATDAELSDTQRRMAGIETLVVTHQLLGDAIAAPGEVVLNAYRTTKATPRISAQVIKRHAYLGDHVKKGQPLVTLSSVEMAEAQGMLMQTDVELRRVKKLGRKVVSEKRYVTAQISYQQAYAKVRAYGMTVPQITRLLKLGDATQATGEFALLALQDGTVINDDFIIGEIVEPGHVLMDITDESLLWVEARLTPDAAGNVAMGTPAQVRVGDRWLVGKVAQARHTLDETTRTLALHVEVANPDDALHPGQFVTVIIEGKNKQEGMVVPLAAVLRAADGDWQVFVEAAPGRFEPEEVEVLKTVGDKMLIEGIEEGTTIVSKGAFFVQSEIAKSGFSVHNH